MMEKMKRFTGWFPEPMLARIEAWGKRQGLKTSTAMRMLLIKALETEDQPIDGLDQVKARLRVEDNDEAVKQLVQWFLETEQTPEPPKAKKVVKLRSFIGL